MNKDWQWAIGVLIAPLVVVFMSTTWDQQDSAAREIELRHTAEIIEIRGVNDRQTDRLAELGKLNAETAARLEAIGDRQDRVEKRLDAIEQKSWGLAGKQ